jgi:hypothetical protein
MEMELGYNFLNTSFTAATSASPELSNEEDNSENDECCDSSCGCHEAESVT